LYGTTDNNFKVVGVEEVNMTPWKAQNRPYKSLLTRSILGILAVFALFAPVIRDAKYGK